MSPVSSVESWFFSSLGWNVPMPMRSCSRQHEALDADVRHHLLEVAAVVAHQLLEDEPARRVDVAVDLDLEVVVAELELVDRRPRASRAG